MRLLKLFLLLSIAFPFMGRAQSNYQPGYVIKNTGDTVKGYLNYREWNISPKSVEFKQNIADKQPVIFNVPAIKSFHINGFEDYISYIGPVSVSPVRMADLENYLDTSVKQDSVFLKVISSGSNVKLLYEADNIKYRYFISEKNGTPWELNFYQYLNDNNEIISYAPFIRQLSLLIKKYSNANSDIYRNIPNDGYKEDIFIKYVGIINNNKSVQVSRTSASRFFIGAAMAYTSAHFNGLSNFNYRSPVSSISPLIDFGIDFLNNPHIQRSFFRIEAAVFSVSPTFYGDISYFTSKQYTAKISGQYVYNIYNTDKFKYFVGGGLELTNSFVTQSKLVAKESGIITSATTIQAKGDSYGSLNSGQSINDPYELGKGGADLLLKTGILINKKIEIFIDAVPLTFGLKSADTTQNLIYDYSYSYQNYTYSIGFNYIFGSGK